MQFPAFNSKVFSLTAATLSAENVPAERPRYTGRYFAILKEPVEPKALGLLFEKQAGLKLASTSDFAHTVTEHDRTSLDALYYERLGVVLLDGQQGQHLLANMSPQFIVQPEKILYVPDRLMSLAAITPTWGLQAIRAVSSPYTGRGVRVAILDSGFNGLHPDFANRVVATKSFVPNEDADDFIGHGTHCSGTACGNQDGLHTRYGIASGSELYVAKVFQRNEQTTDSWVLDAITWAVDNNCRVISMSFGGPIWPGQGIDLVYERAGQDALKRGCIPIAAAGNRSGRSQGVIAPIDSPANCPSFLAVGAVDSKLHVADFSCAGINPDQQVDIAAPGVGIYSSWLASGGQPPYSTIDGTSMATPHVAGVLAMLWEKYPNHSAEQIIAELRQLAKSLPLPARDVGVGLLQAPQV